jgi:hypothetical protein
MDMLFLFYTDSTQLLNKIVYPIQYLISIFFNKLKSGVLKEYNLLI